MDEAFHKCTNDSGLIYGHGLVGVHQLENHGEVI